MFASFLRGSPGEKKSEGMGDEMNADPPEVGHRGEGEKNAPYVGRDDKTICGMVLSKVGLRRFLEVACDANKDMMELEDNETAIQDGSSAKEKLARFDEACLRNAGTRAECADNLCEMGSQAVIVATFHEFRTDVDCLVGIIQVVKTMCHFSPKLKKSFIRLGMIKRIFGAMKDEEDEKLHEEGFTCLLGFVGERGSATEDSMMLADFKEHIDVAVDSMRAHKSNNEVQKCGCAVLHYLCCDDEAHDKMLQKNGLFVASVGVQLAPNMEAVESFEMFSKCFVDKAMEGVKM